MILYHGSRRNRRISRNQESPISIKIFILDFIAQNIEKQAERWATRYGEEGYLINTNIHRKY